MTTRQLADVLSLTAAASTLMLPDGTLWSQAAALGSRVKGGDAFSIDPTFVRNCVTVFSTGYPQKVPVDYEHASTTDDPEIRKLRAMGKVPKAGDVRELRAVLSPGDFTGDLRAAAEKLSADAGRSLADPRNLGLWMRWQPTARALAAIQAREYSELSITFDDHVPHNVDGRDQGPAILAVALTNLPFLDDMLPVAADRRGDPATPADPAPNERTMTKNLTMLSVVAALLSKPVATDEDALTELTALGPELTALREYRSVVGAELGAPDPAKAILAIRELRGEVAKFQLAAKVAKAAAVQTTVETTIRSFEKRIANAPLRAMLAKQLTAELEAGTELKNTDALKVLEGFAGTPLHLVQHANANASDAIVENESDDELLARTAQELMKMDPELKQLRKESGYSTAYKQALLMAAEKLEAADTE